MTGKCDPVTFDNRCSWDDAQSQLYACMWLCVQLLATHVCLHFRSKLHLGYHTAMLLVINPEGYWIFLICHWAQLIETASGKGRRAFPSTWNVDHANVVIKALTPSRWTVNDCGQHFISSSNQQRHMQRVPHSLFELYREKHCRVLHACIQLCFSRE